MTNLVLVLGDQLNEKISCLDDFNAKADWIMLCEVDEETNYVPHHPKKIAFLFSAMRHFAEELRQKNYNLRYVKLDDEKNTRSFDGEVLRAIKELKPEKLIVTEPAEWRVYEKFKKWQKDLSIPVEIRFDNRFLCSIAEFRAFAKNKKQLVMEYFYRQMRKKYNILMKPDGKPVGGIWNFDKENRNPAKNAIKSPKRISHKKDKIAQEVLHLVEKKFAKNFGDLNPFHFAVTRAEALQEARHFMREILPHFGQFQDVMYENEAYLYHSLLSSYINAGLLLPLELCLMAQEEYASKRAPLNACEGFIRQILGWREYVRGIYWLNMPQYAKMNFFHAKNNLPEFYWTAKTDLHCISEVVKQTKIHAYSHHIQRLMITGNFAMLAAIDPAQVHQWYLAVYADAYEWVEMPNTLGMALFADGGIMASKPYAASAKYVNRMSNFCKKCKYDPEKTIGEDACPFNALYWNFLAQNEKQLRKNHRLTYMYATLDKFDTEKKDKILQQAKSFLKQLN